MTNIDAKYVAEVNKKTNEWKQMFYLFIDYQLNVKVLHGHQVIPTHSHVT